MRVAKKSSAIALAAALTASAGVALGSGFQLMEQNASGLGNAYAGQAVAAENASTIFFNPAGMTLLRGVQVSAAVNAIRPSAKFSNDGTSFAAGGGTNGGDAGDWNYLPDAYFSWQVTPRFWAGIGITAPFGLKTDYDPTFIGRYQSQKAQLTTYDVNPSVAFKINDFISIGAGASYQHSKLTLDRSFPTGAPEKISLDDGSWGWNAGALFNLGPATRLGLSYRSAVNYTLAGSAAVTGVGSGTATAQVRFPDTVSAGLSHEFNDKWQLLGDVTWTHWSRIQNVPLVLTSALGAIPAGTVADTLDFQFKNSYRVGVGLNYRWTDRFMLKLGVAYDSTPVPDFMHRTVLLPDNSRTWLAFGGKHQLSKADALDVGYAHLFVNDGGVYRNKLLAGQGIVSGSYKEKVDIISLQYSHSF